MTHQFVHACAGSGKTQYIIDHCSGSESDARRLILTLTLSGQDELEGRFQKAIGSLNSTPEVTGWYAFLINHVIRPYVPLIFPEQRVTGLLFDSGEARSRLRFKKKTDPQRYFTATGMLYKDYLEELAAILMCKAEGLVEKRLGLIYEEIIVDEAQDISRSGLDVVAQLLKQDNFRCILVGDSRQSLLDSSLSSRRNKSADRQNLVKWYRQFEREGRLSIEEKVETYRFNQTIADFSDTIFPQSLGFASTVSLMHDNAPHSGVFLIAKEELKVYQEIFHPTVLRERKTSWKVQDKLNPINFGLSKGRTYERVMILATRAIQEFCLKGCQLKDKSACAFYVAITRARYSVAIAVNQTRKRLLESKTKNIPVWTPE